MKIKDLLFGILLLSLVTAIFIEGIRSTAESYDQPIGAELNNSQTYNYFSDVENITQGASSFIQGNETFDIATTFTIFLKSGFYVGRLIFRSIPIMQSIFTSLSIYFHLPVYITSLVIVVITLTVIFSILYVALKAKFED